MSAEFVPDKVDHPVPSEPDKSLDPEQTVNPRFSRNKFFRTQLFTTDDNNAGFSEGTHLQATPRRRTQCHIKTSSRHGKIRPTGIHSVLPTEKLCRRIPPAASTSQMSPWRILRVEYTTLHLTPHSALPITPALTPSSRCARTLVAGAPFAHSTTAAPH